MSVRKRKWTTGAGEQREAWAVDYLDGAGVRRLKTFDRKRDADAFHASARVDVAKGVHVASSASVTVAEAGERWIASCELAGLGRATIASYREHLRLHIVPFIGTAKLSSLTVPGVRAFQDRLAADGRSADMVMRATRSLGTMLADAQERGLVAQNVARAVRSNRRRGKARQTERLQIGRDIPTTQEIAAILAAAKGRWRPFLLVATFCGLRASELRALQWSDVDFARGELHVRRRADRFNEIDKPKSEAGERVIPFGPIVANALKEWRLACPKGELGLLFPTETGRIQSHSNILQRGLIPIVAAALGEPKYTGLHSLRHFFASWCANRRADGGLELPLKVVQERLGHSDISLTANRYSHLFPRADDGSELAAAEKALLLHAT